jgi:hypothetical protein
MTDQLSNSTQTSTTTGGEAAVPANKAKEVAGQAGEQAKQLATEVKEQARDVAGDIKDQAKDLIGQTRTEVRLQADEGTKRVAGGIRTLGEQLQALRDGRPEDAGPMAGYADQARRKIDDVASRLDRDGLDGVMSDLSNFARRRPGVFLFACAGAGFVVARLVRSQTGAGDGAGAEGFGSATPPMVRSSTRPSPVGGGAALAVGGLESSGVS